MAVTTFPFGQLLDDSGALLDAPVATIASVTDKTGSAIASHGATVNGSGTSTPISVDYDAEVKGEAWIKLAVSQAGKTVTGVNAAPSIYAAKDSSRILTDLDAQMSTRLASSGYTAPDNADIVTILSGVTTLLGRTDPTSALTAIKTVTDHLNTALELNGGSYRFTVASLVNAPAGGGGGVSDASVQADVLAALAATPGGAGSTGSVLALLTALGSSLSSMATTLSTILSGVNGVPAALLATTIDGSLTLKQILDIQEAIATGHYTNSPSVSGGPQVTTYYRADGTTVACTDTVTFNGSGQPTARTVAFTTP